MEQIMEQRIIELEERLTGKLKVDTQEEALA
jgi:hypothetical protein